MDLLRILNGRDNNSYATSCNPWRDYTDAIMIRKGFCKWRHKGGGQKGGQGSKML